MQSYPLILPQAQAMSFQVLPNFLAEMFSVYCYQIFVWSAVLKLGTLVSRNGGRDRRSQKSLSKSYRLMPDGQ